jgi:hypothetical protein
LPKALFRELNGRCSYREEASHHQIMTHRPLRWCLSSVQTSIFGFGPEVGVVLRGNFRNGSGLSSREKPRRSTLPPPPYANSERNEPTMRLPRELRIVTTDDYQASFGSRADTRGFREGRQGRCEKPDGWVPWNRQRCYKAHPYWTSNLKYVC